MGSRTSTSPPPVGGTAQPGAAIRDMRNDKAWTAAAWTLAAQRAAWDLSRHLWRGTIDSSGISPSQSQYSTVNPGVYPFKTRKRRVHHLRIDCVKYPTPCSRWRKCIRFRSPRPLFLRGFVCTLKRIPEPFPSDGFEHSTVQPTANQEARRSPRDSATARGIWARGGLPSPPDHDGSFRIICQSLEIRSDSAPGR
jgi:hypothetical protein